MESLWASALVLFVRTWPAIPFSFAYLLLRIVIPQLLGRQLQTKDIDHFVIYSGLFILAWLWLCFVNVYVPDPYLDEVFHIPQAQKYCDGKYTEWDDKITTPPGLYGLTIAFKWIDEIAQFRGPGCSAAILRSFNAWAIVATGFFAMLCRQLVEARFHDVRSTTGLASVSYYSVHTGVNIALLPVLFFFSGLYYTDVASTLTVLIAYHNHLQRVGPRRKSIVNDAWTVFLGILALSMRQTNVFWVVVYMGGLEAVHAVKTLRPEAVDQPPATTLEAQLRFFARRYAVGDVHDPPLNLAWPDDLLFSVTSLGIAAVCNPTRVLKQVWPHITVLGLFASFVGWNGGVVLGDKSNHIATIHITQMLYIWPFLAFFSAPLLLPYLFLPLKVLRRFYVSRYGRPSPVPGAEPAEKAGAWAGSSRKLKSEREERSPHSHPSHRITESQQSWELSTAVTLFAQHGYYFPLVLATNVASLLIVKLNTIIHPFTLADNRHYMFYVFRYTIRRAEWIRYALVGVYSICRWLVWDTLIGCSEVFFNGWTPECSAFYNLSRDAPYMSHPFWTPRGSRKRQTMAPKMPVSDLGHPRLADEGSVQAGLNDPSTTATEPATASTAMLLLLAVSLSLITAPLVEPRYFILPWVFWRLLVPAWRTHEHVNPQWERERLDGIPGLGAIFRWGRRHDLRLVLETAWFVVINVVTMYVFLAKPYQWRAEDGMVLDGGRLQRFMW